MNKNKLIDKYLGRYFIFANQVLYLTIILRFLEKIDNATFAAVINALLIAFFGGGAVKIIAEKIGKGVNK